jgi:beta-lactamase regulating signal transducer with metallopeptidase domain
MNWEIFTNSKLVENIGWTLLHSFWQIAFAALVLLLFLRVILHSASANARYLAAVFALCISFILPVVTFVQLASANSPTNIFLSDNSKTNRAERLNNDARQTEDFKAHAKTQQHAINANDQNVFAAIENLQSFFNKNYSAVLPFVVGLWFLGAAFFALRLGGGALQLHIYKTRKISAPGSEWQEIFSTLCAKLKITQTVKFWRSNLVETPVVIGWFKPVILVPAGVFLQISPRELETIIAHELVHIRRYDAFFNFAQGVIEVLFFYHPCAWWISSVIRREREFAADAAVLRIFENSRITYAKALANLEEIRALAANQTLPPLATAENGGNLMQRITKILQKNTEIKQSSSAWSAGLALALISAVLLTVFSFNQAGFVNAQTKTKNRKIAVGFVSIPPLDRTSNPPTDADATMRLLIKNLKFHNVPAIGFLQGGMISDGEKLFPVRANTVRLWLDAGFEIGIGNFKHVSFYETPYEDYVAGVEKNEVLARKILAEKNQPLRYFSYPYLNTGKTADERVRFEKWLLEKGLSPVKYTIDNQEWMYSYAYDMARNDNDIGTMTSVRAEFISYMSRMFDHYEAYSEEMFGRDIAQTMVLTPSRLVTDSADDLFGMIEKRGYKFVSMNEALSDEVYQTPESFYGKSGISWFERWQMASGKALRTEPEVTEFVQKIWEAAKEKK